MHDTHRRRLLRQCLAVALPLAAPAARACEFYTTSLTVIHPWTRATAPGVTEAVVSTVFQDVVRTDFLIGAQTDIAEAVELVGPGIDGGFPYRIPAGETTALAESGVHLRLRGLKLPLKMGREYPMTLRFALAGATRTTLTVDYTRFR